MWNNKRYYNIQQQPTVLAKVNSSYKKLEKAMKDAPREYEQIKKLVEQSQDASLGARVLRDNLININDIKNSNINPTKNVKIMMNRKINIKSKK